MSRAVVPYLLATAGLCAACAVVVWACSETGPDAPPRANGCIAAGCETTPETGAPGDDGGGGDAGDGATSYPDPLEGTTKQATLVKDGFQFTEGPVWIGGRLLFSDVNANTIIALVDGGTKQFRADSGAANGNAVDQAGSLVTCEGGNHRVTRTTGGSIASVSSTFGGKQYNSPNDVVVRSDGNVYFTDPNYSGNPNIQDAEAVYRVPPGGGAAVRINATFQKPNGIALSPDGSILYVVDNGAGTLQAATLAADGTPGAFTMVATTPGGDGMAVDDAGNLYVADTGGVDVFDKTGKPLGTITVAQQPANCTFGGADRRTLYITARTGLYSIVTNVPGLP